MAIRMSKEERNRMIDAICTASAEEIKSPIVTAQSNGVNGAVSSAGTSAPTVTLHEDDLIADELLFLGDSLQDAKAASYIKFGYVYRRSGSGWAVSGLVRIGQTVRVMRGERAGKWFLFTVTGVKEIKPASDTIPAPSPASAANRMLDEVAKVLDAWKPNAVQSFTIGRVESDELLDSAISEVIANASHGPGPLGRMLRGEPLDPAAEDARIAALMRAEGRTTDPVVKAEKPVRVDTPCWPERFSGSSWED